MTAADRPLDAEPALANTQRVILISAVAALGGFLFGFDTAVINGAVSAIQRQFQASAFALGFAVSAALIGSAVGAWYAGGIADRIGRVRTMVLAAALFTIQSIGAGLATGLIDLSFWRFLGGVGVGIASVVAPAYIAEVAPAHLRGRLGSLQQLAIVTGIFLALLSDFAIAQIAGGSGSVFFVGGEAWRWMFFVEVVPAVVYGLFALLIPESPRYLVARGRETEAASVLREILGSAARARDKVAEIRQTVLSERHPRLGDLRGPVLGLAPIVWIGIILSVFQQFVGINVIFYYSSVLWQAVGFSESDSLTITVITSVTNIATTLVAIALVDKIGRKPLLLVGSVGMTVTLGLLAFVFGTAHIVAGKPQLTGIAGPVALVAANLFVVFFGCSWGPVVWVLLGEMFPNRIRAIALSVAASAQWIANFVVSTTFPPLKDLSLGLAYGLYTTAALLSIFFVLFLVPEPKGKELEQMGG
jgi:SP family sugar:H+ symporter-like MFS transporter